MSNFHEKVIAILFTLFAIAIFIAIILTIFNEQTKTYSTNKSCEELRECILLEFKCVNESVKNNLFGYQWEFNNLAYYDEQREYYKDNCYGFKKDLKSEHHMKFQNRSLDTSEELEE